jgi:hypothetical protein
MPSAQRRKTLLTVKRVRPTTLSAIPIKPETIGLEEIGGSTGAGSERTKIFAV